MTTLPETLVESIKVLVKAHTEFKHEIEELQALANTMQASIDRLVARQGQKLTDVNISDISKPVTLPRAIVPRGVQGVQEDTLRDLPHNAKPEPVKEGNSAA